MIDPKFVELIHREVDGENSPAESQQLHIYFQHNPEAQRLFNDYKMLSSSIDEMEEITPPRALKTRVLNSINPTMYKQRRTSFARLERLFESWGTRRYAFVFSAGIAVGVLALVFFFDLRVPSEETSSLTGTIISSKVPTDFTPGDAFNVNLPQVEANLQTKYSNNIVVAELELRSADLVEVLFTVDGVDMCFSAFKQAEGGKGHLVVNENTSKLTSIGDQQYVLFFTDKTGSGKALDVKILQKGQILHEKTLLPKY